MAGKLPGFQSGKYYPVDYKRRLIYIDPKDKQLDCMTDQYASVGTIPMIGKYINRTKKSFKRFRAVDGL